MSDFIKREDAIEAVLTYFIPRSHTGERGEHEEDFVRTIFKALPSADAPITVYETFCGVPMEEATEVMQRYSAGWYEEVIRCKECQHYAEGHCYEFGGPMNEDDYCSHGTTEPTYKLSGYDEVIEALDNLKLEFTIHGTERVKRMVGDDHE